MFWKKKANEPANGPIVCRTSSTSTTTTTYRTANGGHFSSSTTTSYNQQISSSSAVSSVFEGRKLLSDVRPLPPSILQSTNSNDWPKLKSDALPFRTQTRSAFGGQPLHNYKSTKPLSNYPSVNPAPLTKNLPITYNKPQPYKPIIRPDPKVNNHPPSNNQIKVKKTYKFHDDPTAKVPTYNTRSKQRGSLLVINNIEFSDKRREGAEIDEANMKELFKQMGFTVKSHRNKKKRDMERIIKDHTNQRDLRKVDISVTIIMSHGNRIGDETHIETIDGQTVPTEWVVQQFASSNCEYLKGKPKIFIFQCCRGDGEDIQTDAKVFQQPRAQEDILIAYATVPGFVSYRIPGVGSWYINRIRDVFMEHAHDTHIEDLLKIVDDELAKETNKYKQTSSYESRGFKKCYLNPV